MELDSTRKANCPPFAAAATVLLLLAAVGMTGCATIGQEFPHAHVSDVEIGKTTQVQVQAMFGDPWRVGVEDGERKWTYGRYRYSMFGGSRSKDLSVRFDDRGVVTSYSYNTTEADEAVQ